MRVWKRPIQGGARRDPALSSTTSRRLARRGDSARSREGGEDAKLLAGGHSLLPLMKLRLAAPTLLVDLRKVPGSAGSSSATTAAVRIGAMTRHREVARAASFGLVAAAAAARSPTSRSATAARSAARWRTATRPRDLPAVLLACEGSVTAAAARRRARDRGRRPVPGLPHDRGRRATRWSRAVNLPALDGYGYGYEKFTRRAEDWAMVAVVRAREVERRHLRGRARRAHAHGLDAAARDRGGGRPARPAAGRRSRSPRRPSRPPRAQSRPADLNASPEYKRHLARVLTRGRCALPQAGGGQSRNRTWLVATAT